MTIQDFFGLVKDPNSEGPLRLLVILDSDRPKQKGDSQKNSQSINIRFKYQIVISAEDAIRKLYDCY